MSAKADVTMPKNENELLELLRTEPSVKLLTTPIENIVKNKKTENLQVELVAMQILIAVKAGNEEVLHKNFNLELNKLKFGRSITKKVLATSLDALNILKKLKDVPNEYLRVLAVLEEAFTTLQQDKPLDAKNEEVKEYKNEQFKEVLVQFEANGSIVYLLNLVNRVYAEELFIGRVNRILSALEILAAIRETNENKLIEFGKMTLEDLRKLMKNSVSFEIAEICLNAALALNERLGEVEGVTEVLTLKAKELKVRFEHIVSKLRES